MLFAAVRRGFEKWRLASRVAVTFRVTELPHAEREAYTLLLVVETQSGTMLEITPNLVVPDDEFEWSFARSGGPGGQNVNKVASKAVLRWDVTHSPSVPEDVRARFVAQNRGRLTTEGVFLTSSERTRSQLYNKQDCLDLLGALLLAATKVPKRRKKTRPTRASKERRLQAKKERSSTKSHRRTVSDD